MRTWLFGLCFLYSSLASAENVKAPLFLKLINQRTPAVETPPAQQKITKLNYANTAITPHQSLEVKIPPQFNESSDLTKTFIPTITDDIRNYMILKNNFEDKLQRLGKPVVPEKFPDLTAEQREDMKAGLIKNYLENQLLEGFLVKKLTTSSETIQSVNETVKAAAVPSIEASPSEGTSFGTDTNLLKRRARLWLTSPLVDGEARLKAHSFSIPEYQLHFSKTFDLQRANGLIKKVHGEFNFDKDNCNSLIRTDFSADLNFSYQREIRNRTDLFMFNFNQSF